MGFRGMREHRAEGGWCIDGLTLIDQLPGNMVSNGEQFDGEKRRNL